MASPLTEDKTEASGGDSAKVQAGVEVWHPGSGPPAPFAAVPCQGPETSHVSCTAGSANTPSPPP